MKSSVRLAGAAFALLISLGDGLARSLDDRVLTGSCHLDDDLEANSTSPPWPLVCLRGNVGADLGLRLGDEQNDSYLNYAELYAGLSEQTLALRGTGSHQAQDGRFEAADRRVQGSDQVPRIMNA